MCSEPLAGAFDLDAAGGRARRWPRSGRRTLRQIRDQQVEETGTAVEIQPHYDFDPAQYFAACRIDEDGNRSIVEFRWSLVPA